jgi:hypothetical protein
MFAFQSIQTNKKLFNLKLLKDWPDIVHVVFTIGILAATLTTQHLLFIPKVHTWLGKIRGSHVKEHPGIKRVICLFIIILFLFIEAFNLAQETK